MKTVKKNVVIETVEKEVNPKQPGLELIRRKRRAGGMVYGTYAVYTKTGDVGAAEKVICGTTNSRLAKVIPEDLKAEVEGIAENNTAEVGRDEVVEIEDSIGNAKVSVSGTEFMM